MNDHFIIQLVVAGTFVLTLFALFLIAILIVQKNKQNKYQSELAIQKYKQQNQILKVRLEAQEEAMNHLSKEIHDNVSQLLGLTQANVYLLIDRVKNTEDKNSLKIINDLVSQVIADTRNLSHSLNSNLINKLGLLDALKNEVEYINTAKQLNCQLVIEGQQIQLTAEKEILIFRIAQEAIHNALKHSGATTLDIQLKNDGMKTQLCISDNGVGFDDKAICNTGIGFINMRERAQLLNASLDIQSIQNKGTHISLTIENEHYA